MYCVRIWSAFEQVSDLHDNPL